MITANDIFAEGKRLADKSKTWADLSNALFDPLDGLIVKRFPDSTDRAAFYKSDAYEKLHKLVEQKMQETGVVAGAEPTKSGRFVVRVPRTLHTALEREAIAEGTSLNQLVVAKLSAQLASLATDGTDSLIQAFLEVRGGASADRVVADPDLNRRFLRRCRELALSGTDYELNWRLLGARKNGLLKGLPRTKRFSVPSPDEFEYASELAVRHIQRTQGVTLDQVICDPVLAERFDEFAARLAPGRDPFEYRWVALGLRKAGQLQKGKISDISIPDLEFCSNVRSLKASSLPQGDGLYLFSSKGEPIFLSQTSNLRHRIERHMEVSESRGLPQWLWDQGFLDLSLAEMPGVHRTSMQAAELLLVRKLHPILNIQRVAA